MAPAADHRLDLIPDGCVEISCADDGEITLFGPATRRSSIVLPAGRRFDGVRLHPGAAAAVLGIDVSELVDEVVAGDLLSGLGNTIRGGPSRWMASITALAVERANLVTGDPVASVGASMLAAASGTPVSAVARQLGLSDRQFRRRFVRAVGLPPATFRRIERMQRAIVAATMQPSRSLTTIAAELGYADQAHLGHDVRALTGRSPSDLRDAAASEPRRPPTHGRGGAAGDDAP